MSAVEVCLHGRKIGQLAHRSELGDATEFRLDADYIHTRGRPVLGQCFEDDPSRVWRTTHLVPAWFSNLLPEGVLRRLLARRAGVNPERELHLLAALGQDLPGAVTVRPMSALAAAPVRPPRLPVPNDEALRFSLAGLQLKYSVDVSERGATLPIRGQGGRWIAKLPDPRYSSVPENEAAMLAWATRAGLDVPEHRLVDLDRIDGLPHEELAGLSGPALLVRRFDRGDDGHSVHIEDFAQIRGVFAEEKYKAANYESIGRVIYSQCGEHALREYVRRLMFMLLSGNADMHLKNWSLIYPDKRRAALAPAYDLVATIAYAGTSRTLALKFAKTRAFSDIGFDAFARLARKIGADEATVLGWAREAFEAQMDAWRPTIAALPPSQATALAKHHSALGRLS